MKKVNKLDEIWYRGLCSPSELERILYPRNAFDHLLHRKVDIISNNTRYTRQVINFFHKSGKSSISSYFDEQHYENYISYLCESDELKCKKISYGDLFDAPVNAFAEMTEWGPIIYINESLKYYNKFFNLCFLYLDDDQVPNDVKVNSLRIATRLLLGSESMDFRMDPRGIIPQSINNNLDLITDYQMAFIVGHEFGHFFCNHLDNNKTKTLYLKQRDSQLRNVKVYSQSHKQEFEADIDSLNRPLYDEKKYKNVFNFTIIWFYSQIFSEKVLDIVNPRPEYKKSHPPATARISNILNECKIPKGFDSKTIEYLDKKIEVLIKLIEDELAYNFDIYEQYGSCYLSSPNTAWRGKELVDRVDY
ncbi:hypothetical protein GTN31_01425 [Macrococcoides canis]|uniref:Putative zinc-dependent metallopeptidase n=1 Tax=Macrococcoides canis TaxID=1855823 RepID=A0A6G7ENR9_9STAP|nr:hypothetical protein [Macrococcus canis]QHW12372.1 putative zinc-dependent metallopeptidase [Macrococcus canis]QIH75006.1 hypothetical protein GTN31_01425 [Macrococcus canis]